YLGPLEQRRRSGEVEGDAALLHRRGDGTAVVGGVGDENADRLRVSAAGEQLLGLAGDGLRLRALVAAAPEVDLRGTKAVLKLDLLGGGVEAAEPIRGRAGPLQRAELVLVVLG